MKISQLPVAAVTESDDSILFDNDSDSRKLTLSDLFLKTSELLENAGTRRLHYRGKNLGSRLTADQSAQIYAGTFDDLWLGDYWLIDSLHWRIWDFDYWYKRTGSHNVTIIPDETLGTGNMYNYVSVMTFEEIKTLDEQITTGYSSAPLRTSSAMTQVKTLISQAFPDNQLTTCSERLANYKANSGRVVTVNTTVELPNRVMLFGNSPGVELANDGAKSKPSKATPLNQLALAKLTSRFLASSDHKTYWLRDQISPSVFAVIDNTGDLGWMRPYTSANGAAIRPVFSLNGVPA